MVSPRPGSLELHCPRGAPSLPGLHFQRFHKMQAQENGETGTRTTESKYFIEFLLVQCLRFGSLIRGAKMLH